MKKWNKTMSVLDQGTLQSISLESYTRVDSKVITQCVNPVDCLNPYFESKIQSEGLSGSAVYLFAAIHATIILDTPLVITHKWTNRCLTESLFFSWYLILNAFFCWINILFKFCLVVAPYINRPTYTINHKQDVSRLMKTIVLKFLSHWIFS